MANVAAQSTTDDAEWARWAVRLLLLLFVLICIFDPADLVIGGKVQVFIVLWPATLLSLTLRRETATLSPGLLVYVLAFIAMPLLSILWYYVINGQAPFEGFQLLKGYLLISLALILFVNKIDLVPPLSAVLTVLAVLVLGIFIAVEFEPSWFVLLFDLGVSTGIFYLDRRSYGPDLTLVQIYFVTSPLLAFSIAYYFDRAMSVSGRRAKLTYSILVVTHIAAMLIAGTRNNILVALVLPFILWPLYTEKIVLNAFRSLFTLVLLTLPFVNELQAFFDADEPGNSIKLVLVQDYIDLLNDPITLLFGQGLGAYHFWSARGYDFYVSELTYLEIIRNFGLVGFVVMMALLLFPVAQAFSASAPRQERALAAAYFLYLLMAISNPHLFASTGTLMMTVLLANIAMNRERGERMRSLP